MIIYVSLVYFCDKLIYIYIFFLIPHRCLHFEIIHRLFTSEPFLFKKRKGKQEGKKLVFIDTSRINKSTDIIIRYNYKVPEEKLYPFSSPRFILHRYVLITSFSI